MKCLFIKGVMPFLLAVIIISGVSAEEGYYIDDGISLVRVEHGDPQQFKAKEWKVRLFRKGEPQLINNHWGSISGKSANKVMNELRKSQTFEKSWEKWCGCPYGQFTYFNPLGPIAVIDSTIPKRQESQKALDMIENIKERLDKLTEPFDAYKEVEKMFSDSNIDIDKPENPFANVGVAFKEYTENFKDVFKRLSELQKTLDLFIYPEQNILSDLDTLSSDLNKLVQKLPKVMEKIKNYSTAKKEGSNVASLLFLIDVSGSMEGDKLNSAKNAAIETIKKTLSSGNEAAVIAFSGNCASPFQGSTGFTKDKNKLIAFIQSLQAGGGTPLASAIRDANQFMKNSKSSLSGAQMILLLADGDDQCGDIDKALDELQNSNTIFRHETVGLGIEPYSQAAKQLENIASVSGGRYHYAQHHSELANIFSEALDTMEMLKMIRKFGEKPPPKRTGQQGQGDDESSIKNILDGWE